VERAAAEEQRAAVEYEVEDLQGFLDNAHEQLDAARGALAESHSRVSTAEAAARDAEAAAMQKVTKDTEEARADLQRRADELQGRIWQLVRCPHSLWVHTHSRLHVSVRGICVAVSIVTTYCLAARVGSQWRSSTAESGSDAECSGPPPGPAPVS
jgi:hypothetical protein